MIEAFRRPPKEGDVIFRDGRADGVSEHIVVLVTHDSYIVKVLRARGTIGDLWPTAWKEWYTQGWRIVE